MSRVHLASDTCDIYFTYTKVNHLLYMCSLDPLEDGILLDTPSVCMHRYCLNITDVEEECERKCTSTPSLMEAWKRRRKKGEEEDGAAAGARPDVRTAVRIIRTLPRIVRVTAPKTPEGFHRSRIIQDSVRIIRTPDARIIRDPIQIIRPCLCA